MNKQQILEELLALLEVDGVIIRREELGGSGGGICTLKGHSVFFLDTQASSAETASLCADAVLKRIEIEQVFIKPEVREFIEKQIIVE
ncbi:MAG: hypothetical protein ACYST2_04310 [Planctomycetota bacterium]|jgi:hypothetical protein